MKKRKMGKMNISKKSGLFLLLAWVVLMVGATIGSLGYEKETIPKVWTDYPKDGTIVYTCQVDAAVLSEEEAELVVPHTFHLNSRLFQEGTDLGIGVVTFHENGNEGHYMKIRLKEKGTAGETLPVEINYTNDYSQVVDNQYIYLSDAGVPCVYQVAEEEGAWGKEYWLREMNVVCFPADLSTEQVAILSELENPIVMESSGGLKGGERVRLMTKEPAVKEELENKPQEEAAAEESEPEELTGELTILAWLPFNKWEHVIEAFTEEHPKVTVTVEMSVEGATESFMEQYTTRIMAGEEFDLVESEVVNMEKCAGQDVFADLYELMDADGEFNREDYFSCIFEPMEIDGKLPAFAYNVQPVYIHLNKKLLEEAGLVYEKDTISFKELYELYEKVRENVGEGIYLTEAGYGYEGMNDYEDGYFIRNNLMDSEEYEEYLKMRHELYSTAITRSPLYDGMMKIEPDVLCFVSDLRLPNNFADVNEVFEGTEDMTGAILYESMHGENYPSCIATLSISNFSEDKQLAWEFIKFAFGDSDNGYSNIAMISPNRKKAENACAGLTPENKEKLFWDIEAINTFKFIDSNLYYNLNSVYEDYFVHNSITAEECRKELGSRVYLYMNEEGKRVGKFRERE